MDTSYNYPQLFDMEDADLFQGLNLSENTTMPSPNNHLYNNNFDKKLTQQHTNQDIYNSLASASNNNNSYLHYLQSNNNSNNNNNNEFYYDPPSQVMLMAPTMDLTDYDYFNQQTEQKEQYNWLYDPIDSFLPNQPNLFCDNSMINTSLDSIMTENMEENITVEGGMSRGYVSLSDVNSFVAKADSKHSCLLQVPNDFNNNQQRRNEFSSSESTTNEDSEDDYSDSENELRWPLLNSSFSTPTNNKQKLMIKIKKPISTNALPSPYGEHPQWTGIISPKLSKSTNTYRNKYRKSASNIYNITTTTAKKKNRLLDNTKRRGSAPQRLTINHNQSTSSLGSLHSSSSLSSLSNTLQRSMRVSDSMNFLSRNSSDDETIEDEEEEDEDDDEYQLRAANTSNQIPTKKGRNVDKACNHCKRSHLRCDDMRPCRRCVATGKTGCKDVQHKPRGRPKLHKK